MKISFLTLILSVLAISSVYSQSQMSQERDPKKNEELYFIPEIRIGYGFLDTNYPLVNDNAAVISKSKFDSYVPMSYSAFMNFGYHFTPQYAAGVGVGIMQYSEPKSTSLPTYVDLRGYLYDAKNTPFAFAKLGVCLQWWKAFTPGSWATIGVGYKFFSGKQCFTASLGYEFKHITDWELMPDQNYAALNRHSITITLGMVL